MIVLGSTGSIGTQALGVIEELNAAHARGEWHERLDVVGLAGGANTALLAEQARRWGTREVAVRDERAAGVPAGAGLRVRRGEGAAEELVRGVECDLVVAAVVGVAGLAGTLAAAELGRDVALANKESLVAGGALVVPAARRTGARVLPIDSEHSGVWQCLAGVGARACPPMVPGEVPASVRRVWVTASGGPFRGWTAAEAYHATREAALRHPTWSMGPKVTVDSATLANKALELIEAHWLFGLEAARLGVLIHPQSVVHALVEFADGSTIAQMGVPDMRTPIRVALTHPGRLACGEGGAGETAGVRRLDWSAATRMEFEPADAERHPALSAAYEVMGQGGTAGAVFNAANEEAVRAFLGERAGRGGGAEAGEGIPFGRITELACGALREVGVSAVRDLGDVLRADAEARRYVRARLGTARGACRGAARGL